MRTTRRSPTARPPDGRFRSGVRGRPAVAVLLLAPYLGEVLSTSTPPLDLLVPWILALQVALYGCGALLCRELARRLGLGLPGLALLAAAYAVYEEALVTGFWFSAGYQDEVGIGSYGRVWETNLLVAGHLTAFHVAVSICSSILLVERLFPAHRDLPWAGRRGLAAAAAGLLLVVPLGYGESLRGPTGQLLAATTLILALTGAAVLTGRPAAAVPTGGAAAVVPTGGAAAVPTSPADAAVPPCRARPMADRPRRVRPRLVGTIAFAGTGAHFLLTYTVASTGLPWPAGTALALAPIAVAALLLRRRTAGGDAHGPVGLRIVTGILAFFVLLDAAVGLGGRYDLTAAALLTALALRHLNRHDPLPREPRDPGRPATRVDRRTGPTGGPD